MKRERIKVGHVYDLNGDRISKTARVTSGPDFRGHFEVRELTHDGKDTGRDWSVQARYFTCERKDLMALET
jgi:hypothetical protein